MEGEKMKWFLQAILAGPGMDEPVKHSFTLSRTQTLLLGEMINYGLLDRKGDLINCVPEEMVQVLQMLRTNLIEKANLTRLTEQMAKGI